MPSLFKALRPAAPLSAPAYDAAVNIARARTFYLAGQVPDTMDGRFALLSSVVALVILRLEREGDAGRAPSVALTEAFIGDMDAQMREQGFDATLSKQVRSLVGSLASRVDTFRRLAEGDGEWPQVIARTIYRDRPIDAPALGSTVVALRSFSEQLAGLPVDRVIAGDWIAGDWAAGDWAGAGA